MAVMAGSVKMACQNTEFARGIPLLMLNPSAQSATISPDPQKPCPCGTGIEFASCCAPRLNGSAPAQTAEQLMRSRYTAHVVCDVAYLLKTWKAPNPQSVNPDAIKQWAQQSDWQGLVIHQTADGGPSDQEGWVEFSAFYLDLTQANATPTRHRENSRFVQHDGHWFYVEGETVATSTGNDKTGRNSPCPCGSGKKFKRCCGL